jgi:hypothetical protein
MTTTGRTARYLIANYYDLRDVVLTIEQWISETGSIEDQPILREACSLSVIPLSDGSALIMNVHLPHEMIEQVDSPAANG